MGDCARGFREVREFRWDGCSIGGREETCLRLLKMEFTGSDVFEMQDVMMGERVSTGDERGAVMGVWM